MIRTQISLSEEQVAALRRLAAARRVSMAAVIRDALDDLLAREAEGDLTRRFFRSVGAHGSGEPGGEAAERHDDYLDEAFTR